MSFLVSAGAGVGSVGLRVSRIGFGMSGRLGGATCCGVSRLSDGRAGGLLSGLVPAAGGIKLSRGNSPTGNSLGLVRVNIAMSPIFRRDYMGFVTALPTATKSCRRSCDRA